MFNELKQPLKITIIHHDRNDYDELGNPKISKTVKHVIEPVINTANPNLTYNDTVGGQQSTLSTVWESKAIRDAPRNTIVEDSHGHKFKTVGSTNPTPTGLWYYQLKETDDKA